MSTISNASFAGGLFKFEMLRNTYYGNHLFTIWRNGWKYATVAFRNSAFLLFYRETTTQIYNFSPKKMKNNNKQTECPLSCPWCADSRSQTVEDIYVTHWHPKKTQKDILVNALALSLRQYCDYVCYISAPIYLNCKWRCKKLNRAATEITLRFYCALIRTQSHDPYFEHANNTVRQLSVWL